jgi:aspartate-semialdehyde dehydrogenase
MHDNVPLVVPEVNGPEVVSTLQKRVQQSGERAGAIIANPNCSTIQLVVVLKPILEAVGLKRVVVSTYQSVSGAGQKGIEELWDQTLAVFNQQEMARTVFPHQIAFNVLPQIDTFLDNGYTKEEMKVINESRKILSRPELKITSTAVRVPVFSCHSESVNVETERPIALEELREILVKSPGVMVLDNPTEKEYPLSADLAGTDAVYIGRLRRDESLDNGFNFWVVADNLRKGAALNAVQIAELVLDHWGRASRSH